MQPQCGEGSLERVLTGGEHSPCNPGKDVARARGKTISEVLPIPVARKDEGVDAPAAAEPEPAATEAAATEPAEASGEAATEAAEETA